MAENKDLFNIGDSDNVSNRQKPEDIFPENTRFPLDLEELIKNPQLLGNAAPAEWYGYLKKQGFTVKTLRRGTFGENSEKNLFEKGGGFRVHWSGDRILQYHPPGGRWHGEAAYWKLSDGGNGTRRFDLSGIRIIEEQEEY